ncbi:MAG: helix-turn-helix transcriptional regulator [Oscillospiraceae bacterium]|nr:helix-turn-helix transcriptional regulator [Oscillospiraceae bacterium]
MSLFEMIKKAVKPAGRAALAESATGAEAAANAGASAEVTAAAADVRASAEIMAAAGTSTSTDGATASAGAHASADGASEATVDTKTNTDRALAVAGAAPGKCVSALSKAQAVARLSPREAEVFAHCLKGAKMKDIADAMHIKTSTVNSYCKEVYKKLGVNSKTQLILQYFEYTEK